MVKKNLPKLQAIFFALGNPNRLKIYELCLKQEMNITQISEKIRQSYKSVLNNLRILEDAGMIEKKKVTTDKAQETLIKSMPFNEESVYHKVYKELKRENK